MSPLQSVSTTFNEVIAFYSEIHTTPITTLYSKFAELINIKVGGT